MFSLGADGVAGGTGLAPVEGVPPHWDTVFAPDDRDAPCASVTANGGSVMAGPFDVLMIGRSAACTDPTGAVFQLVQHTGESGS